MFLVRPTAESWAALLRRLAATAWPHDAGHLKNALSSQILAQLHNLGLGSDDKQPSPDPSPLGRLFADLPLYGWFSFPAVSCQVFDGGWRVFSFFWCFFCK